MGSTGGMKVGMTGGRCRTPESFVECNYRWRIIGGILKHIVHVTGSDGVIQDIRTPNRGKTRHKSRTGETCDYALSRKYYFDQFRLVKKKL